ncbi:MAG: hypothetical protein RRC07_13435 [Anaerolineae bacterium]|nr:hypothetical protein [Anaerolineae bacterium]
MNRNYVAMFLLSALLLLVIAAGAVALAQTSAGYNLEWHVVGSGGGEAASASYRVHGTTGQGVASPPRAGGASYTVSSGYWYSDQIHLYLPVIKGN